MNVKQPVGHPTMIFESLWVPPNLYAAEGPLVVAGQLSLTGVDSFYWFASGGEEWGRVRRQVGLQHADADGAVPRDRVGVSPGLHRPGGRAGGLRGA